MLREKAASFPCPISYIRYKDMYFSYDDDKARSPFQLAQL